MTKKKGSKRGHPEHDEQVKVFKWAEIMGHKYPALHLLMAIPNGAYYGGHWSIANRMKAEGVKSGVPDVFLPVPRKYKNGRVEFNGLWIEMKVKGNRTSEDQKVWIANLREQGYKAEVCFGAKEAIDTISEYLNLEQD
jgi:hypothetical protein